MTTHLTMSELEAIGFETIKSFEHDGFITQRRKKGVVMIETTWGKDFKTISQEMKIDNDTFVNRISKDDLIILDKIFNK